MHTLKTQPWGRVCGTTLEPRLLREVAVTVVQGGRNALSRRRAHVFGSYFSSGERAIFSRAVTLSKFGMCSFCLASRVFSFSFLSVPLWPNSRSLCGFGSLFTATHSRRPELSRATRIISSTPSIVSFSMRRNERDLPRGSCLVFPSILATVVERLHF